MIDRHGANETHPAGVRQAKMFRRGWVAVWALAAALGLRGVVARADRLPGVLIELSLRGGADTRPTRGAPWTVQLVVRTDGTFTAHGRSGRLADDELRVLRGMSARARLALIPQRGPMCEALPTQTYRVRTWRGSVVWSAPCAPEVHRSVRVLVEQAAAATRESAAP